MSEPLLEVKHLTTSFYTEKGKVTAVEDVSFTVKQGETLALVGESGCGKSVTAESILRLLDERTTHYSGEIHYQNQNLLYLKRDQLDRVRGKELAMIFQDPMASLNPVYPIRIQLVESMRKHLKLSKKAALKRGIELLALTGIPSPEEQIHRYPHELSGGMRQRVMIAIALACQPHLLIADEPTTALDVSIQAQILDCLVDLKEQSQMSMILITHDLAVVAETCDRIAVMYLGEIVEMGGVDELFARPLHPYTIGLMKSMPTLHSDRSQPLHQIEGTVPTLHQIPAGCRFAARCEFADEVCFNEKPDLVNDGSGHEIRCWHYKEIESKRRNRNEGVVQ